MRMKTSKTLAFLVVMLFIISLSSALDSYPPQNINQEFTFCQTCQDATYVTLSTIQAPNTTITVGQNMTANGFGDFCYNYTPQLIGVYDFRGISDGCLKTFATNVPVDIQNVAIFIIIFLFFIFLGVITYIATGKINFDKWHASILSKYNGKNTPKIVLSGMFYGVVKNSFWVYYLIGWPVVILLIEMSTSYGMTSLIGIMESIFIIYAMGLLVVAVLLFGRLQEFVASLFKDLKDMDWGINQ